MALKRPNAISFSKKENNVRPFEDTSNQTLEFWSAKNDASMFVIGQSTKKRPDGLTFVRMYDGRVLDMLEVGVDNFVSLEELKVCTLFYYNSIMLHSSPPSRSIFTFLLLIPFISYLNKLIRC